MGSGRDCSMGNHADKSGDPDTDSGLGDFGASRWIGPDWFDRTVRTGGTIVTHSHNSGSNVTSWKGH
jgi:hypothetical protein